MTGLEFWLPVLAACLASISAVAGAWTWRADKYLCDSCKYNNDIDCLKTERPQAIECKSFQQS